MMIRESGLIFWPPCRGYIFYQSRASNENAAFRIATVVKESTWHCYLPERQTSKVSNLRSV